MVLSRAASTFSERFKCREHRAGIRSSRKLDFEATWLDETRLEVTSRSLGSRILSSRSLRAQESSARSHLVVEKTRLEVISRSRKLKRTPLEDTWKSRIPEKSLKLLRGRENSGELCSTSLRGRDSLVKSRLGVMSRSRQSHFEVTSKSSNLDQNSA